MARRLMPSANDLWSRSDPRQILGGLLVLPLALVPLVGCAGATSSSGSDQASASQSSEAAAVPMPPLVGERLDVAYSDLEAIGVVKDDVELLGGGTFGVVSESNWTVCEQRPDPGATELTDVRLVVDRTCPSVATESAGPSAPPEAAASAAASPTAEASEEPAPSESPEPEASNQPDSPVYFSTSARGNLKDLYKDLADMRNAVDEGSMWRVMGNALELSFNIGQLQALTPPTKVAADWKRELAQLEKSVDAVSDAITDDASVAQLKRRVSAAQAQTKVALGVVRQLG